MRRNLINAGLALLLVPAMVFLVLKTFQETSKGVLAFQRPAHRVAVAVDEAMRLELASVAPDPAGIEFELFAVPLGAAGKPRTPGENPEELPYFFFPIKGMPAFVGANPQGLTPFTVTRMGFEGKTRDGRAVQVTITTDPIGEGSVVDFHGDEALARALSPRIADRLAHPKHKHESPEDRDALIAFFNKSGIALTTPDGSMAPLDPAVKKASAADEPLDPAAEDK